jgi:uncharacterized protein (DUF433 family)
MLNFERISVDPAQMGGVPCVRRLRIPVATVLRLLACGRSESEILSYYPSFSPATIQTSMAMSLRAYEPDSCQTVPPGAIDRLLYPSRLVAGKNLTTVETDPIAIELIAGVRLFG